MRAGIPDLPTAHPIGEALPAVYAEDPFAQRFTAALDEVLAPVLATLDCITAYLDPVLTPDDVLTWLTGWVAIDVEDPAPLERRREAVRRAVELHRRRGTLGGIAEYVRLITGHDVDIADNGGVAWSSVADGPLPGTAAPGIEVRVRSVPDQTVDIGRLEAIVSSLVPVHIPVRVRGASPRE